MKTQAAKVLRRSFTVGLAGLTIAALAACGAQSPTADDPTSEPGGERATIRLVIGPVFYEVVRIAEQEGYFEDENLDVVVSEGGTAAETAAQLIAGQVDIAMSGGVSIIQGAVENLGIRMILGGTSADPTVDTSGIIARADSGIDGCEDLAGKTVALQGLNESTHLGVLLCADAAGIDPSSITFVQLPLPNLNDAVLKGDVDATYNIGAFYGAGIAAGLVLVNNPTRDVLSLAPSVVYAATDAYVEENEDVVKRFQAAIIKAAELGRADDFAAIREIQLQTSQLDPEYIKTATQGGYQTDLYRSGTQKTLDGMFKFGFIPREISIDEVISPIAPLGD